MNSTFSNFFNENFLCEVRFSCKFKMLSENCASWPRGRAGSWCDLQRTVWCAEKHRVRPENQRNVGAGKGTPEGIRETPHTIQNRAYCILTSLGRSRWVNKPRGYEENNKENFQATPLEQEPRLLEKKPLWRVQSRSKTPSFNTIMTRFGNYWR